ncbi:unnamed protein product [Owenia fusiformis]|uniref:Uncharacterized protein n=1 Tax=Owenia fusiformis TaxID=6347 RepID=A0A8J1XER2_OWEFU|nr:unnamed protein product [Owenia fusiformis]
MRCFTKYCKWNSTTGDYIFRLGTASERVDVYALMHTEQCNAIPPPIPTPAKYVTSCHMTGYFSAPSHHLTDILCRSRSNTFIEDGGNEVRSHRCYSNQEGTGWLMHADHNNTCFSRVQNNKMFILPYPGTPNCRGNQMYVIKRLKQHCQKSTCSPLGTASVARDLRQCMLFACDAGANVINYRSANAGVALRCEMRSCRLSPNGEPDLVLSGGYRGFEVYALHLTTLTPTTSTPTQPSTTTMSTTTTQVITTTTNTATSTVQVVNESTATPSNKTNRYDARLAKYQQENTSLRTATIVLGTLLSLCFVAALIACIMLTIRKIASKPKTTSQCVDRDHAKEYVNQSMDHDYVNEAHCVRDDEDDYQDPIQRERNIYVVDDHDYELIGVPRPSLPLKPNFKTVFDNLKSSEQRTSQL